MPHPMKKQGSSSPGMDYGDDKVPLSPFPLKTRPPLCCYCWMESGMWEKPKHSWLEVVLLLIRPEAQHCFSAALADVTQCHLGTGEQWDRAGTASLAQTHSSPATSSSQGPATSSHWILVTGTGKHGSINLFANSLMPVFPGEENERLQQA